MSQRFQKSFWSIQTGKGIYDAAVAIEHVMNAVASDGALDFATVPEINRDARNWPHGFPMENEMVAQILGNLFVRVKRRAKESAIRATEFFVEFSEETKRENRFAGR